MVDPVVMCDRHLLGEHVELHMLAGNLRRGRSIQGYLERELLEPASLVARHEALVAEMAARGFRHASPIDAPDPVHLPAATVDPERSLAELTARCDACSCRVSSRRA